MRVLGIDPGTRKVGMAIVEAAAARPLHVEVAAAAEAGERARELCRVHGVHAIAVGAQTGSQRVADAVRRAVPQDVLVHVVDERGSSYEARSLYWRLHPPRGLLRLVPRGMLVPPEPIDGYAAAVIAGRFLEQRNRGTRNLNEQFVP